MLTARAGVDDRIAGLDDGATTTSSSRSSSASSRARRGAPAAERRRRAGPLRVGSLELDPARHEATQAGEPLAADAEGVRAPALLHDPPGEALSEFELLTHVWDENANPLTRTVRVTVMTLRRKLTGNPIETVQGAGYRLREDA